MLGLTPERYHKNNSYSWDECDNAYMKPKPPVYLRILENLHKKTDFDPQQQPAAQSEEQEE